MRWPRAASLVLCAAGLLGCAKPVRTVIVITLDTTRADRLGCYGYAPARTPALDALAKQSALFEHALAPVPVTLPSHASMFTGEYPPVHGVRYNGMFRVAEKSVLLAERLKGAGFRTAAVPSSYPVARGTGIAQGFEVYRDLFSEATKPLPVSTERSAEEVTRLGLEWLAGHPDAKTFLWLHYFTPHAPYEPPFPYSAEFRDRPYDGEIAYLDQALGQLFDGLKKMKRWDEALILVAGDHGEGLYDHGEPAHSDLVYQSTLHVPLLVKAPGIRGRRVADPVSLVDVTPTVLELVGLEVPAMAGRSLVPLLRGREEAPRALYFESIADSLLYGWSPLEGVRRGPWKYVRSSSPELYHLESDAAERVDRHATDAEVVQDLEAELQQLEKAWAGKAETTVEPAPLDPRQIALFVSLGYMVGAASTQRGEGLNPKDGVHLTMTISQGQELLNAGKPAAAMEVWKPVLREDPKNRLVLLQAAHASIQLGDLEGATRYADRLVEAYPDFAPGTIVLGELWVHRGDPNRAAAVFEAAASVHPDDHALTYRWALALLTAGRVQQARRLLEDLVTKEPENPALWLARGAARARAGDAASATSDFEEAVRRGYDDYDVLATEPLLEPLRRLPGYPALAARVKSAGEKKGSA